MHMNRRAVLKAGLVGIGTAGLASRIPSTFAMSSEDSYSTNNSELSIHPVAHASFVIKTPQGVIYVDPVGGAMMFAKFPQADLIMITHHHGDHFDPQTLVALAGKNTKIVVNPKVMDTLGGHLEKRATALANGDSIEVSGVTVDAIPAYNTTKDRLRFHPKGRDNGYVLTIDGTRVYVAGDTEDIPEMRALRNIDIAFVPMNKPYTMEVEQAASGVLEFAPKTVYPYHHAGSDVKQFEKLVNAGGKLIKVVKANWYG